MMMMMIFIVIILFPVVVVMIMTMVMEVMMRFFHVTAVVVFMAKTVEGRGADTFLLDPSVFFM